MTKKLQRERTWNIIKVAVLFAAAFAMGGFTVEMTDQSPEDDVVEEGDVNNDVKKKCVEWRTVYQPSHFEGLKSFDEMNSSFYSKKNNYTDVGGSVWYDINVTKFEEGDIVYVRNKTCVNKKNISRTSVSQ